MRWYCSVLQVSFVHHSNFLMIFSLDFPVYCNSWATGGMNWPWGLLCPLLLTLHFCSSFWEGSYMGCSFCFRSYPVFHSSPLMLPAMSLFLAVLWRLATAGTRKIMLWWASSKQCLAGNRYFSSGSWQCAAVGRQYAPLCLFRFDLSQDSQGHPSWPEMSNHSLKLAVDKLWQGSNLQALRAAACSNVLPKGLHLH